MYDTHVRRLILTLLCAFALPLSATELRVASPGAGEVVRGGESLTLEWSASALPSRAEEWEAFLSIDGGRYYAFRVTPHLDLKLRRVAFEVPNVATSQARILIRAGDEREEHVYELPWTFSIVRTACAEAVPVAPALSRGESAREGDPGVVAWAEGDRAGTRVAMQRGGEQSSRGVRGIVRETSAPVASGPYVGRVLQPVRRTDWRVRPKLLYAAQQPPPDDLLLVCRRRNV